jgi:UDP-GlcNAc:undecaprenyl-phosphate GlcNAc-1-phosphate transferase
VPLTEPLARRSARSTPRDRARCTTVPTPSWAAWRSSPASCARADLAALGRESRAILAGAIVITLVGAVDDVVELNAAAKLLGQIVAVSIPVAAGVKVENFTFPFFGGLFPGSVDLVNLPLIGQIDLGDVGTVLGIVAVINVINLADGVDGLAAGVCAISAITLAVIALSLDRNAAGCSPRSPPALRSASCAGASRRRASSWGTPAPTCSATCWG